MAEKELTFAEHQSAAAAAGWKKLTKAERSAKARHAVKARWAMAKRKVTAKKGKKNNVGFTSGRTGAQTARQR